MPAASPSPAPRGTNNRLPLTAFPRKQLLAALVGLLALSGAVVAMAQGQPQFAHTGFQALWSRTDGAVTSGATLRPWIWGPQPGKTLNEPFAGIPGNNHLVQYFDKGRMELNNPNGDPKDPFFVTSGLLDVELVSGQMQIGVNSYQYRGPAPINLASDSDDLSAPTYQSFNGVSSIPGAPNNRKANPSEGQVVRAAIDRQGVTQPWPSDHPDYGVRIARYEPVTGHNIPDVFWTYLNSQGTIIQDGQTVNGPLFYPWLQLTGYPISEPYWSYVKVAGQYTDVLIQAYERRVLTFIPHLPSPNKVQMGNIGAHYYEWRYLGNGSNPSPQPPRATPTAAALPALQQVVIVSISYRKSIVDLNGTFTTLTNKDQSPVVLDGWWLDSPKWDHVDRYYFPNGVVLQPGQSINVHSGPGLDSPTDLFMYRTTVMWDQQPYDLAVLYDKYGREVTRFFPAAETGVPPTAPPAGTPSPQPVTTPPTGSTPPTGGTPPPSGTAPTDLSPTPTRVIPSPVPTGVGTIGPSPTPARSPSPTASVSTTGTVTVTSTVTTTPTATATPPRTGQ